MPFMRAPNCATGPLVGTRISSLPQPWSLLGQRAAWFRLRLEPDDSLFDVSKHADVFEQPTDEHLEHLHRVVERTAVRDDGATAESMRADLAVDLARDRFELRDRRKRSQLQQV